MNERMMILKMLDEGKITLEEADALLEALGTSSESQSASKTRAAQPEEQEKDEPAASIRVPFTADSEELEDLVEQVEDEFDQMADELDEMEDILDDQLEELDDQLDEMDDIEDLEHTGRAEIEHKIGEVRHQVEERRIRINEQRTRLKEQKREYIRKCQTESGISAEIRRGMDDLARSLRDMRYTLETEGANEVRQAMRVAGNEFNAGMRELRDGLNEGARELRNGLQEGMKEMRKAFKGKDLKNILGGIFGSFGHHWPGYVFEDEIKSDFDLEKDCFIDIRTNNGKIEVIGSDREDYQVILKYEIAADNEEEAKRLKSSMVQISVDPTHLKLEPSESRHGSVSVKLLVPANLHGEYKLKSSNGMIGVSNLKSDCTVEMTSSNGRLEVANVRVAKLNGRTSNGRIEVKDVASEHMDLQSSNGSIFLDGICEEVMGRTSNGSITVYPHITDAGNLKLHTSNGRVKVVVADAGVGVDIEAKTTMGSITLAFPELVYIRQVQQHGRRDYKAHSTNYETAEKKIQIEANTSMGSIYIGQSEA